MNPQAVRDRMLSLEKIGEGSQRTVVEAVAEILGVACDEDLEALLVGEVRRTQVLCRTHYAPRVAVLPNEMVMAAALVQGVTLAVAVLGVGATQVAYLREDAADAGEASMQAVFWRERAIALGASPDEYER